LVKLLLARMQELERAACTSLPSRRHNCAMLAWPHQSNHAVGSERGHCRWVDVGGTGNSVSAEVLRGKWQKDLQDGLLDQLCQHARATDTTAITAKTGAITREPVDGCAARSRDGCAPEGPPNLL